ncbi:MAG: hypothetical protein JKY56_12690 [Kofleriaceae bacterium]|nr:hypothetical protein [Kofleriaceae bacterium]
MDFETSRCDWDSILGPSRTDYTTPMHRAAQQAIRMRVRRIVASDNRHMRGVFSGLDFAAFVVRASNG